MTKNTNLHSAIVLCGALLAGACQSASSPAAPTDPEPATLTGMWRGAFTGTLVVSDAVAADLAQTGDAVTGTWTTPMPATLVTFGAPADVALSGPVAGTTDGMTAELSFEFEGFPQYFPPGCALALSVSFDATMLEGTWETNSSCAAPVVDSGTMTMTRQ